MKKYHLKRNKNSDCQTVDLEPEQICNSDTDAVARAVLAAVARAFEDPAIQADYEKWLIEYRKQQAG